MAREKLIDKTRRTRACVRLLRKRYPGAKTSLSYLSVHQLMVATILSAQCTDERVNLVTPGLFKKYPSVEAFARASVKTLARDIFTTGFHNQKAKSIIGSARTLVEKYGGKVPRTLEELVRLPGVGRKTASVILGNAWGIAEGIVVDTHVARLSRLLGFTAQKDPVKVERNLMKLVPKKDWIDFSHMLILHGRAVCIARRPDCGNCILSKHCPSARM